MTTLPAIPIQDHGQLATRSTLAVEGLEGLDQRDIILPRVTIVQMMSKGSDAYGQFRNNLTEEVRPSIDAVILRISRSRTLWSGALTDTMPECSSYDGVTSRDGRACVTCPENRWPADENDKHVCKAGYVFLCAVPDADEMFLLGAMGKSVRPAKILISQFATKKRAPFSAVVQFTTTKMEDAKGKYYVLKPAILRWLDATETAHYRELYLGMQSVTIQEVEPEPIEEDGLPF